MNKIISSYFVRNGVYTVMENPSPRARVLMENISFSVKEIDEGKLFAYTHIDIGTCESLETLFAALESCE